MEDNETKCLHLDDSRVNYSYTTDFDTINIISCCGQCYAIEDIKYCPFCGKKLKIYPVSKIVVSENERINPFKRRNNNSTV